MHGKANTLSLAHYFQKPTTANPTTTPTTKPNTTPSNPNPIVTTLDRLYWIPSTSIKPEKHPWARPKARASAKTPPTPYALFEEVEGYIGVPRFYGERHFGPPTHNHQSLGEPMHPDVMFTWTLESTRQKPQTQVVEAVNRAAGSGLIVIPCGAGKTVVGIYLLVHYRRKSLIVVHNEALLVQWFVRLQAICPQIQIGLIQGQFRHTADCDVVLGMIQTLVNIDTTDPVWQEFGMILIDECHHVAASTWSRVLMRTPCMYRIGLTATPNRTDGLEDVVTWLAGPIVYRGYRHDTSPMSITQILYKQGNQREIKSTEGAVPLMINRLVSDAKRNQLIDLCLRRLVRNPAMRKLLVVSGRRETHIDPMVDYYVQPHERHLIQLASSTFNLKAQIQAKLKQQKAAKNPKPPKPRKRKTPEPVSTTITTAISTKPRTPVTTTKPTTTKPTTIPYMSMVTSRFVSARCPDPVTVGMYVGGLPSTVLEHVKSCKIIFATYDLAKEAMDIPGLTGMILATPCVYDIEQVVGRLREGYDSMYGLLDCTQDEDVEQAVYDVFHRHAPGATHLHKHVLSFLQSSSNTVPLQRRVYDIVDDFGVFQGLGRKHKHVYEKLYGSQSCNVMSDETFIQSRVMV